MVQTGLTLQKCSSLLYDLLNFHSESRCDVVFSVLFILRKKTFSIQLLMSNALQRKYPTYAALASLCFSFQVLGSLSIP